MITLIGNILATEGLEFIHCGPVPACEKCRFKNTCIDTLEEGRMYKITQVKDTQHPCAVHEGGKVKVVNVEKANIKALIDSKIAFEGSNIVFNPPLCDKKCDLKQLCTPNGLYEHDRCKIIKNIGKAPIKCAIGLDLHQVILEL
ncbi:MAG: UPF0179 family protein [Methanobacterium sp.]|nr:UPF0179 family protein [Methanobacterium sp.]